MIARAPSGPAWSPWPRLLIGAVAVLRRLPDAPQYRAARWLGIALSFVMRRRRALVRANLRRVCRWLDDNGMASERVRAASRQPRSLDALVRDAFGHWVTAYVESAMAPRYDSFELRRRLIIETPAVAARALAAPEPNVPGRLFAGLHFGSVELAALYAARLGQVPVVSPMETVSSPARRAYFERVRGSLGISVVPVEQAAGVLLDALRRGEAAALVADRLIGGRGIQVTLFGAPARLPAGPAVLAVETGASVFPIAVRRIAPGHWRARLAAIETPREGTRRQRVRSVADAQARAFEALIADAPEQWWTVFFPIWDSDR